MNSTLPESTMVDNITIKDITLKGVLDKLKDSTARQRAAEQKAAKLTKELEEERKKQREVKSCTVCKDAVLEMNKHSQSISENVQGIRDMFMIGKDRIKMKDGVTYTIYDLAAKIERSKCFIQKNAERYDTCCKDKKLPEIERFTC